MVPTAPAYGVEPPGSPSAGAPNAIAARATSIAGAIALAYDSLRRITRSDSFALADLGDISLPPVVGDAADQDLVRLVTPLYLASELEAAGLLDALDTAAGLFATGGIEMDLGEATRPLIDAWRSRGRRFSSEERHAIHARLFGSESTVSLGNGASNTEFEPTFIALVEVLARSDSDPQRPVRAPSASAPSLQLAQNLAAHAAGVPPLASRELLQDVKTAVLVFGVPEVQHWLGARSVWSALEEVNRRFSRPGRTRPDVMSHVRRGSAGVVVLAWLADALPEIGPRIRLPPELIDAAVEWIDATIALWSHADLAAGS